MSPNIGKKAERRVACGLFNAIPRRIQIMHANNDSAWASEHQG